MEALKQTFDQALNMIYLLWNTMLSNWGLFGSFVIGIPLLRKLAQVFNRLKS